MRARQPDDEGLVERDGVKIGYEVFGVGPRTVVLAPYWPIVPSRAWQPAVSEPCVRRCPSIRFA